MFILFHAIAKKKKSRASIITATKNFYVFQKAGHISGGILILNEVSLEGRGFPMSSMLKVWYTGQQHHPELVRKVKPWPHSGPAKSESGF